MMRHLWVSLMPFSVRFWQSELEASYRSKSLNWSALMPRASVSTPVAGVSPF